MKHLLDWLDVDEASWTQCIQDALLHGLDRQKDAGLHKGKSVALVFFNDSLRTRVSMELAAGSLGAQPVTVTPGSGSWGFSWEKGKPMNGTEAEHIQEAVGVLSRYADAIGVRLFASGTDLQADMTDARLRQFTSYSDVPVLNLESASRHPCQALADAAVLTNHFGGRPQTKKLVLSWTYHPKALPMAVPHSTLLMASRLGMDVTLARPQGFELDPVVMDSARRAAAAHGGSIRETDDLAAAADGAQIIYAKSWGASLRYSDPDGESIRRDSQRNWRITSQLMSATNDAHFMHCLPVRRGVVVDDEVIDGPRTLHLDQAEYRLHAQKAILNWLWDQPSMTSSGT